MQANKNSLVIRYEGLDSDKSQIDLRQFGQSLVGIERIVSIGMTAIEKQSLPKGNFKPSIITSASALRAGSFEVEVTLAALGGLYQSLVQTQLPEFVWNLICGTVMRTGGRKESVEHVDRLLDMLDDYNRRTYESDERRHKETMRMLDIMDNMKVPVRQALTPIDKSCESMQFAHYKQESTVDVATAYSVRSQLRFNTHIMYNQSVTVDGLIRHKKQLKVIHPAEPNQVITAVIRDPAFDREPNIYTRAVATNTTILATGRIITKMDGRIHLLYITSAV